MSEGRSQSVDISALVGGRDGRLSGKEKGQTHDDYVRFGITFRVVLDTWRKEISMERIGKFMTMAQWVTHSGSFTSGLSLAMAKAVVIPLRRWRNGYPLLLAGWTPGTLVVVACPKDMKRICVVLGRHTWEISCGL